MLTQRIHEWGGTDRLRLETVDVPKPQPGQVRVAIAAIGVNPVDWKVLTGKAPVPMDLPLTPGGDIAGTVDAIGDGVTAFAPGDRVFGLIGLQGAYAEQVVVSVDHLAAVPEGMDIAEAAGLPLAALTALQGMQADGRPLAGLDVLVHGAAGGVGTIAVQLAAAQGARVTGSASASNADFVRSLGASAVVDFRQHDLVGGEASFDMLIDLVGNSLETGLWSMVREGGSVVRIAGGATAAEIEEVDGVRVYKVRVRPSGEHMRYVAQLAAEGRLKVHIEARYPFADAIAALERVKEGHVRGKVVLTLR
jgi:NADPH:quinone reductase-like Zn-dependent oxidoreductase